MFITDIHSLGVDQFAGTQFTDAWYWNFDAQNKKWADRFTEKTNTRPSFAHAANYSAAMNYLEAIQEAGTDDADAIVGKLEGKKINDVFLRNGEIRKADHAVTHDVYLAKVKARARGVGLRGDRQDDPGRRGVRRGEPRLLDELTLPAVAVRPRSPARTGGSAGPALPDRPRTERET